MRPTAAFWRYPLLLTLLLAVLLAGCTVIGQAPAPTETAATTAPTTAPTVTAPAPTAASPTDTTAPPATETSPPATPTAEPQTGPLPAPVYFVSPDDGQLWRVERDGVTLTQITHEAAPVSAYDVSPANGSLVYVSANTLILAGADGLSREPVFSGPQDYPPDARINNEITAPRWSPDGQRIAFGYGGIQMLDLNDPMLAPNVLIPSDPVPDPAAGRPPTLVHFYIRAIWSPDGTRLLVEYIHYPEGGGWASLLLNSDGGLVDFQAPPDGGLLCCEPTWSLDGTYVYFASPYVGLGTPGLRRVTAATGETETLIAPAGEPGSETYYMVEKAQHLADGQLYYFMGSVQGFPTGSFTPMTMYRAGLDGANAAAARADSHLLEEVLWAPDAAGAVIMQVEQMQPWPYHGPLFWLPADGSPAVPLAADGANLAWGQ